MRLRVLQPVSDEPRQDCSVCANQKNCWLPGISDRHIVTNLLVCRIKRGIDVARTTKLLLELVRPKLLIIAQRVIKATGVSGLDRENVFADLQAEFVSHLQHRYQMGEYGYPLHYLFNIVMRYVEASIITNRRKDTAKYHNDEEDSKSNAEKGERRKKKRSIKQSEIFVPDDTLEERTIEDLAGRVNAIINDGVTLRTTEFRVLRFCLDQASDAKRPLNGLHIYQAKVLGVVRSRVTKIFHDAMVRIKEETLDLAEEFHDNEGRPDDGRDYGKEDRQH